jgi:hypothetical protein
VYGQPVEYHGDFNGKKTWYLYPTQDSVGYFEISKLLEPEGKTYDDMRSERKPDNFTEQLTMDLRLEFRDELGNSRALPGRRHFFDFSEKRWVPELTRVDEWK